MMEIDEDVPEKEMEQRGNTDRPKGFGSERNKPDILLMTKALIELYREQVETTDK